MTVRELRQILFDEQNQDADAGPVLARLGYARQEEGLVSDAAACPKCGEARQDRLVWEDDTVVRCGSCGTRYEP
jgi:hypothetical protein